MSLTLVDLLEAGALPLTKRLHATGSSAMAVAAINHHWEAAQS